MKKTRVFLFLAVLALLCALAACGGRTEDAAARGIPVEAELRQDESADEPEPPAAPDKPTPEALAPAEPEPEPPAEAEEPPAEPEGEAVPILADGGAEDPADADRAAEEAAEPEDEEPARGGEFLYVLNTNTKKIHNPWCASVSRISPQNYQETSKSVAELEAEGYVKCRQKGDWD